MLFNKRNISGLFVICFLAVFVGIVVFTTTDAGNFKTEGDTPEIITSVPRTMTYQGILKDSEGNPINGILTVNFNIYNVESGGSSLWDESQDIEFIDGYFTVELGTIYPLNRPFDEDYWLELVIGSDILSPRQKLTMSAYSARTDTSDYAFVGGGWVDDGTVVRLETQTDKVGIGTTDPQIPLHVNSQGAIHQLRLESTYTGGGYWDIAQSDDGFGSGGGLLVFTPDGVGAVNSVMVLSNSGNVGIGTTSPDDKLEIDGNTHITGDLIVDGNISPFPLRTYISEWFECVTNTQYHITHNLGTTKILLSVYFATDASGTNMELVGDFNLRDTGTAGCVVHGITTTALKISSGTHMVNHLGNNWGGSPQEYTSGFYRVIILALE